SPIPMDELAGGRRRHADSPPLPDDMLAEILLLLPPEPIHLFRTSFVSKRWRGLVHDARFLRRFREFHGGTPPMLGFFNNHPRSPLFVPTSGGFAASTAAKMSHDDWWALHCRHGHALLQNRRTGAILVWDLVTGDQRHLPLPTRAQEWSCNGAVLCAAGHADHGDCRSCPFLVAYVFSRERNSVTSACTYSSETGVWSELTSIVLPFASVDVKPMALVGNTLYCLLDNYNILEFDLDNHRLGLAQKFPRDAIGSYHDHIVIMPTEDGRLGLAGVEGLNLHLWSLMASIDGLVTWTHERVIDLENFLAPEVVAATFNFWVEPIGFAEDAGVIFIYVHPSVYMIHLKSMQIEEVPEKGNYSSILPYTSFYAPGTAIVSNVVHFTLIWSAL
uniref:F-box domain-containing protein n=1 Tax=Aegilops tauschii subsp. strangulata TaxID=200361 RepID=A0A453MFC3_AEGTS